MKYLGFVINDRGLNTDPDKVAPIVDFPAKRITDVTIPQRHPLHLDG